MKVEKVTLDGFAIRLEPLSLEKHFDDLCAIGFEEEIWRWTPTQVRNSAEMRQYIEIALEQQKNKSALPFATILKETNQAIGSTRFGNIDVANLRVEIGWTWIGLEFQRTFVNTEAKFLMLRHAFETWNCNRVELKTDRLNERSRRAILRIGAKEEGVLRKHVVCASGRIRDTVYYSIVNDEWTRVKEDLQNKLQAKS